MGVARDASQDDIKRAYRKLARKYHPDVSKEKDAEARFKELGEAYEVLKDLEKRTAYDQLGANWKANQEFRPPPGWNAGFEFSGQGFPPGGDASQYSDFFESLFGQAFRTGRGGGPGGVHGAHGGQRGGGAAFHHPGEDHYAKVMIDLEDSYTGATRAITLQVPEVNAQGHVSTREHKLNIKIPKGIRAKQQIRLAGQSAESWARQAGRLVSGDRISLSPVLSCRWRRCVSRSAACAVGSRFGRNGQNAYPRRNR